jgi:iron complex transport system substrate-binding protein
MSEFTIVSCSPAMTEIIFALGAGDRLVGVTTFCDYPEKAKSIYKIGDLSNPSLERIVGLRPDLVVVNLPEQARIRRELEKFDIPVFVSSPTSLDDIYKEIQEIGMLLSRSHEADSIISHMKKIIKPVIRDHTVRVYVELSPRPLVTIGANSFINDIVEMAGAVNIFADLQKDYPVVSQEQVITRNPDIIIVLHPVTINDRTGWQSMDAIKNGKVYTALDQDYILRPGPRLTEGYKQLSKIFSD